MTVPANITLTEVTETYLAQSGTNTPTIVTGTIEFRATNSIYINDPGSAIFVPDTVTGTLDGTGTFTVELIPEDDEDLAPTGFTYDVTEKLSVGSVALPVRTYSISVPSSETPIRLSSIAPAPPSGGVVQVVLSINDIDPDVEGNVTLALANVLPLGGIPESDLSAAVQAKLDSAGSSGTVTQVNGVDPDGSGHVTLAAADVGAYALPGTGIPKTDLAMAVQNSLTAADAAAPDTTVVHLTGTQTVAGVKTFSSTPAVPDGSWTKAKLATAVQTELDSAEQTANKNSANGYAGLDAAGRSGAAHAPLVRQIVALTFASTLTIDASAGSLFRVTLTGAMTLAAPSNPADGQTILVQFAQDGTGGRVLTLDTVFNLGPLTATLSTGANAVDYLIAVYRSAATKWDVLSFGPGY